MPSLDFWQWFMLTIAALMVGFAKTGIGGLGGFAAAIFANVIPAKESTGAILPLLICADIVAVFTYHPKAKWKLISNIAPWTIVGVIIGFMIMKHISDQDVRKSIGIILVLLTSFQILRKIKGSPVKKIEDHALPLWAVMIVGIIAGITTMLANAAGPLMAIYFLSLQLPKLEFMGTGAWYFFLLNVFKVPFSYKLGLIHPHSIILDLILVPAVLVGAFGGRILIHKMNQNVFEWCTLGFTIVAGIRLLL